VFLPEKSRINFQHHHTRSNFAQKCFPISSEYSATGYSQQSRTSLISQPKLFACNSYSQTVFPLGPCAFENEPKAFSNVTAWKKNEHLMQQNRILINYKKLKYLEETFSKNNSFLKKNFDYLLTQLKNTTASTKLKYRKKSSDRNINTISNEIVDLRLNNKTPPSVKTTPVKQSSSQKSFKNAEECFGSKEAQRSLKTPIPKKAQEINAYVKNPCPPKKFKFLPAVLPVVEADRRTKTNSLLLSANINSRNKLARASLSVRNDKLFSELDKFNDTFIGRLLLANNQRKNKAQLLREMCVKYPTVIAKNVIFREQIEFSKSMIEFTLCLHKILSRVDKVYID